MKGFTINHRIKTEQGFQTKKQRESTENEKSACILLKILPNYNRSVNYMLHKQQ